MSVFSAGGRPAGTPPVGPVTGWQLLHVVTVKFACVRTESSLPAWHATQFDIDCGYSNSIAWDM